MSKINNGGPAFPLVHEVETTPGYSRSFQVYEGMTLRDYLAAHAPIERSDANDFFYREYGRNPRLSEMISTLVELRLKYADAMLAAREEGGAA